MSEFIHLLGDPAHWAFEITGELVTAVVVYPLIRLAVKAHDKRRHS